MRPCFTIVGRCWSRGVAVVSLGTAVTRGGMTPDDVGDTAEIPDLLDQIDADVASMTADGAYDGEIVYDAVAKRHPDAAVITLIEYSARNTPRPTTSGIFAHQRALEATRRVAR
jgi:hypothetical protein